VRLPRAIQQQALTLEHLQGEFAVRKLMVAPCLGAAIAVGAGTPASAAVDPIDIHNCFTVPDVGTTCTDVSGHVSTTTTPSGVTSAEAQTVFRFMFTATDGTVFNSSEIRRAEHLLIRDGVVQSSTSVQRSTFTVGGQMCTFAFDQQVANGELIFNHFRTSCR
jgi:hypothetical protein